MADLYNRARDAQNVPYKHYFAIDFPRVAEEGSDRSRSLPLTPSSFMLFYQKSQFLRGSHMPIAIDIAFQLPETLKERLEKRIRQVLCEAPPKLLFVRVRILEQPAVGQVVVGDVYRITLCGAGALPLEDEREFLLYCVQAEGSFLIGYIAK